jgi:NitT/TauT family transport system substrate-binding protein
MMKKINTLFLSIFVILTLFGCQPKKQAELPITMIVPFGSPSLSQVYLQNSEDYLVDIVQGADPLVAAFGSKSHDVIFAPTNLGSKMYQAKPDYILLAVVVWGNTYLVTEKEGINTFNDLHNQTVVIFGRNQTSDIVFEYIKSQAGIFIETEYVENVTLATEMFLADTQKIVMVAEPALSRIQMLRPNLTVIDLQELYETYQQTASYPQAGVFIKKTMSQRTQEKLMRDLENSIQMANQDPVSTAELAIRLGMNLPKAVLVSAIPKSNLHFRTAKDSKIEIENYFRLLLNQNSQLIGGKLPEDAFYGG